MDLSIIIVTHNSENYILNCLTSVEKAVRDIEHEILVIDNNSTDHTKALVKESKTSLLLVENSENDGFARAINRGLKRCSGEFSLILNPDIVIQSESLKPMINFMRNNPTAGICGCKLLNADGSLQYSMGSFPTLFSILCRIVLPRRMRKYRLWGYDKLTECDWVTGAFVLVRNTLVRQVGYLDENYFLHYEDVDYCLQAGNKGWKTYYYPGIAAYHFNPHALTRKSPLIEEQIRKSRLYFFDKNVSKTSGFILSLLTRFVEERLCTLLVTKKPCLAQKDTKRKRRAARFAWGWTSRFFGD
jgi:GT2 family glycosyltransferase